MFNNSSFHLAFTDHSWDYYHIQEYVPPGQAVDSYTQMVTLLLFANHSSAHDAISGLVMELNERKKTVAVCNYETFDNADNNEYIIDLTVGETTGDNMMMIEFNVYRYTQVDLPDGRKAVFVYGYRRRSFEDDITGFSNELQMNKTEYINKLIAIELPKVTAQNKQQNTVVTRFFRPAP